MFRLMYCVNTPTIVKPLARLHMKVIDAEPEMRRVSRVYSFGYVRPKKNSLVIL